MTVSRDRRTGDDIVRGARLDDQDARADMLRDEERRDRVARASDHLSAFAPTPVLVPPALPSFLRGADEHRRLIASAATTATASLPSGSGGAHLGRAA